MSQLTIYKASAGSGKTYRLVMEYLKLLMENPYNYRHILAVTFTNKATNEMKERILRDLHKVATSTDIDLIQKLTDETGISALKIEEHARLALAGILHDYDRFAVSTIDSFFQRVLRSFARESGLYGTYEVELDQNAVLEEACDRLLLSVDEDDELRKWLIEMSEDQLGEGKNWRINDKILELGKELFNEAFQPYLIHNDSLEVERDKLKTLKTELAKTQNWFEGHVKELAGKAIKMIGSAGLEFSDFKGGSRSFVNYFNYWAEFRKDKLEPTATLLKAIDEPENWVTKKHPKYNLIIECVNNGLNTQLKELVEFINGNKSKYLTAVEIQRFIYALGVLTTLSSKVREIGLERNTLLLSEGNMLLRGIIGQNDAPFVYEKTGNYYNYFMIDEFQDTSVTQWENFKPLVSNSLAENHQNLVVGDVKQSIYRWRNSDWQLLNSQLAKDLNQFKVQQTPLDANWRSSEKIVQFNNQFFDLAKTLLQDSYNYETEGKESLLLDEYRKTILLAYDDVQQKIKSKISDGYVQCNFIDKTDKDEYQSETINKLIQNIKEVQDKGYKASDIAILVQKNNYGKTIAEALLKEKKNQDNYNFEVVSDDTLFIVSSATVRFLMGLMHYLLVPSDQIIKANVVYEFSNYLLPKLIKEGNAPLRFASEGQQMLHFGTTSDKEFHFISTKVRHDYFPFFDEAEKRSLIQHWAHLSLIDLTEELIHRYALDQLTGEQANLQAFKDVINDFSKRESGNLHKFVAWWDQYGETVKLQTAAQRDAIRIMTIHKSKGLEFPIVFLPFCDWSFQPKVNQTNILWYSTANTSYQQFPVLPVKFVKNLQNTEFSQSYYTELLLSYIDNLNVLYVAQTRAIKGLYLFAEDAESGQVKTVSHLFDQLFRKNEYDDLPLKQTDVVYSVGFLPEASIKEEKVNNEVNLSVGVKHQKNIGESLKLKRNYIDFLDDAESKRSVHINAGKLMHEILSYIKTNEDIESALQQMLVAGKISETEVLTLKAEVQELLTNKMAVKWFGGEYRVLNETTIVLPEFDLQRPDRVMIGEEKVIVVDYKATSKVSKYHRTQVLNYMKHIQAMGYSNVDGFVWYLKSNRILNINDEF